MIPKPPPPPSATRDVYIIQGEASWIRFWQIIEEDFNTIDLAPTLTSELGYLEELHNDYFFEARGPGGDAWPALQQSTIDAKGHATIMVDSGRLINSLTQAGPDSIRQVHSDRGHFELVFGTAVEYSIFHDEPTGNRPARQHVGWDDPAIDETTERVLDGAVVELSNA